MATTMTPPTAAPIEPAKRPAGELRFVSVRAHLLPGEVVSGRQLEVVRKQVVAGLIAVVVLLIGWYGYSKWQTHSANSDLSAAQAKGVSLQSEQNQFTPLVQAQGQITAIKGQLQSLMADDLPWKTMLITLRAKAPAGISITSIDGTVNAPSAAGASVPGAALNTAGLPAVGNVTLTGTAPDKRSVAAYADRLATVSGLNSPFISNVTADQTGVTFSIEAVITSAALGGRYSTAAQLPTGGK